MKSETGCDSKLSTGGLTLSGALNSAANAFTQAAGAFRSKGTDEKINITRFCTIVADGKECILALIGFETRWQAWLVDDLETTCLADQSMPVSIREFCLLPGRESTTENKHFLVGLVRASSDSLTVFSVEKNCEISSLEIGSQILGVQCTAEALLIRVQNQIHGYNPFTMTHVFTILTFPTVYSQPETHLYSSVAPFSSSSSWVAYPGVDEQARTIQEEIVSSPSSAWDYLQQMGEIAYKASSGVISRISRIQTTQKQEKEAFSNGSAAEGFVTIKKVSTRETIACFKAHNSPIACLRFSHGGLLLATASVTGKRVKIFEIHKRKSTKAGSIYQIRLKHILYRGMTENRISWISFSPDDSLVSVSSGGRGTTHVYALESIDDLEQEKEMHSKQSATHSETKSKDLSSVAKIQGRWGIRVQLTPLRVYEALGSTCYSKLASRSSYFGRLLKENSSETDLMVYLFIISESGTLQSFCMQLEEACNHHEDSSAIRMKLAKEWKMDTERSQISIDKLHELSVPSLERPPRALKCDAKSYGFRHPNKSIVWGQTAFKMQ